MVVLQLFFIIEFIVIICRVADLIGTTPPFLKARNFNPGSVLYKGFHFVVTSVPCGFFPGLLGIVFLVSFKHIG